ncbi:tryptophan 7-halogenase [Simiduia curdlanivorans]|uniref:Tryptophan 7-halogenase n=1 Tax=Simiduia curdlanivorans TaxID=1492769 RepID=A0ABV8V219_9GAMM|nr:tryptophan 7-halogenase [Simiduia curdlanivorans]MDN3637876.1 tryptophan 7-halogenase [Simiduia curdlanivorans]
MSQRWVIYGNDASSWSTALFLHHQLPARLIQLTLVVAPANADLGLSLNSDSVDFHRLLDIDEREFLIATQASIQLAHQFSHWSRPAQELLLSSTPYGDSHQQIDFFHWLHAAKSTGGNYSSEHFNLNTTAAKRGHFSPLPQDAPAQFKNLRHGYQVSEARYCKFLRTLAERRGLKLIEAEIANHTAPEPGSHTVDLVVRNGKRETLAFDYFITTKSAGAETAASDWRDCSAFIPTSKSETHISPASAQPLFVSHQRHQKVWQSTINTQRECIINRHTPVASNAKPAPGFLTKPWQGNHIYLGQAACSLADIFENSLAITQRALFHLLALFPFRPSPEKVAEFNRRVSADCESLLDLHNGIFFSAGLIEQKTHSFDARLALFLQHGYARQSEHEFLSDSCWLVLLAELYQWPDHLSLQLDNMDKSAIEKFLNFASAHCASTVRTLPPFTNLLTYLSKAHQP